jgi:hypothetical protein
MILKTYGKPLDQQTFEVYNRIISTNRPTGRRANMRKPWVTLTIDKDLLDKLDGDRRKKITDENKDISRSAYISDLIVKGLKEVK